MISKAVNALAWRPGCRCSGCRYVGQCRSGTGSRHATRHQGRKYIPTIWVDPDGCEHWVMDDGVEGYMSPHVNAPGNSGLPQGQSLRRDEIGSVFCHRQRAYFQRRQGPSAQFFQQTGAKGYIIAGHTDSRASDAYNMRLSLRRANAVARSPRPPAPGSSTCADMVNASRPRPTPPRAGMAKNRRVEIICVR